MGFWSRIFNRGGQSSTALVRADTDHTTQPTFHGGAGVQIKTAADVLSTLSEAGNTDTANTLTLYEASVWAYACASLIARAIASVPLRVEIDGEPAPEDDLLVKLLQSPAPKWSYNRFAQASALYMTLTGSAYWQKIRYESQGKSEAVPDKSKPGELWVFGEDSYATSIATTGRPIVQHYTDKDGHEQSPEDVIQAMYVKPGSGNEGEGAAPAEAARSEAGADVRAAEWQEYSLKNRMVPDGIFRILVEPISDEQYNESEKRIQQAYAGSKNAHRPMVLGQEVDWIDLAKTAVEMDYINGRKLTRETIAASFGVPPVLIGILDHATYSNYDIAQEVFWTLTILPLLDIWTDQLNAELAPEFSSEHKIYPDTSQVPALLRLQEKRWDLAGKMLTRGVPMEMVNNMLNLGLEPFPGWSTGLVPSNLIPIDTLSVDIEDV